MNSISLSDRLYSRLRRQLSGRKKAKVFGIGALKTGTTSLGKALETLGYKHTHAKRQHLLRTVQTGRLKPVISWAANHDSFDDWPWPLLYREMASLFPKSKFILTIRDSARSWLRSMKRHAELTGPTLGRREFFGYDMPHEHEETYLDTYRSHNQDVRRFFSDMPERFLEVCWENGDSWQNLCTFLGKPIPDAEFPHLNSAHAQEKTGHSKDESIDLVPSYENFSSRDSLHRSAAGTRCT